MKRNLVRSLFIVLLGIAIGLFYILITKPADYPPNQPKTAVSIIISNGETGIEIATDLAKNGVIKSAKTFISDFNSHSRTRGISPGTHLIDSHIPTKTAVTQLLDQGRIENLIIVKEGSTLSDVIKELGSSKELLKRKIDLNSIKPLFANPHNYLEGSLYPANYSFAPKTSPDQAIRQMIDKARVSSAYATLAKGYKGFSSYQLLTIASLIQIEADPASASKVAQVIYNRLKIGMPLQLNSTVQYATGQRGKIALSKNATLTNSPYNTYKNLGLPPSPICNPAEFALKATLNPENGDWLYFITVAPGDTRFTKSFEEFQNWTTLFNKNLAKGLFK